MLLLVAIATFVQLIVPIIYSNYSCHLYRFFYHAQWYIILTFPEDTVLRRKLGIKRATVAQGLSWVFFLTFWVYFLWRSDRYANQNLNFCSLFYSCTICFNYYSIFSPCFIRLTHSGLCTLYLFVMFLDICTSLIPTLVSFATFVFSFNFCSSSFLLWCLVLGLFKALITMFCKIVFVKTVVFPLQLSLS